MNRVRIVSAAESVAIPLGRAEHRLRFVKTMYVQSVIETRTGGSDVERATAGRLCRS